MLTYYLISKRKFVNAKKVKYTEMVLNRAYNAYYLQVSDIDYFF